MTDMTETPPKTLPKTLKGRCACGTIEFTAEPEDFWVCYCHCDDCKKATGAPVSTYVGIQLKDITFQGTPKKFATSQGVKRGWCERCGTPISYESIRWPDEIHLHIGMFDNPEALEPTGHVYTKEQLPWLRIADDLPKSREPGA